MKTVVFPITSSCDQRCIFCSHRGNPKNINTGNLSRSVDEILKEAEKIKRSEIIIGESATRINEGEPFLFEKIERLLEIFDNNHNKILITTSGSKLDEKMVSFLSTLKNIELNLSLNSSDINIRQQIMGKNGAEIACNSPKLLKKYKIKYTGSIVALDLKDNFNYVIDTIKYLNDNNSDFIKVFIPGYTDIYNIPEIKYDPNILRYVLSDIRKEIPVLIEPDFIENDVHIKGIFKNSPAFRSGLLFNDIIININNNKVFSQSQTFMDLKKLKDPIIDLKRNGIDLTIKLEKNSGEPSGILFSEDITLKKFNEINNLLLSGNNKLICSEFSFDFFKEKFGSENVKCIYNRYFGGNIRCNGLLTVQDILDTLTEGECQSIIINANFLDKEDNDITGRSIYEITSKKRINIIFV